MWQKYIAYVISFLVIGSFWSAHHRKFKYIRRYNRALLNLNMLVLMVVAFIPFPSSLISISSEVIPTVFYAATMVVGSIMVYFLWRYASGSGKLVDEHLDERIIKREAVIPLITGGIFLASILIAFVNPDLAKLSWMLILLVAYIFQRD
jgi:uncharacterized membrane protein